MSGLILTLYAFEVIAALSALGILLVRSVFHAALLLIICLLSLAGIFVIYQAEFIAVTQILIYAGGILVLIIFGVMLTSRIKGKPLIVQNQYVLSASLMCLFLAALLIKLFYKQHFYQVENNNAQPVNTMNQMGISLISDFALPFEVVGVLLLIALIGAAVTAMSFNSKKL